MKMCGRKPNIMKGLVGRGGLTVKQASEVTYLVKSTVVSLKQVVPGCCI